MRELLISVVRCSAAILWVCFVGPSLARLFGIPIRATFWKSDPHDQQLTRRQFMWVFGVLVFGVGFSIFNLDSDVLQRLVLEKNWSSRLIDLGVQVLLSICMGIAVVFWCAPTQLEESPITRLDLSQRR